MEKKYSRKNIEMVEKKINTKKNIIEINKKNREKIQ